VKHWKGGYVFAALREWRIKTIEQLNVALKVEEEHFSNALVEFIKWLRSNDLNLGEEAEEYLRKRLKELYAYYPCKVAKEICDLLAHEDKDNQSDVFLWWGGEPNRDLCYAFLTLYFETDPDDIGTSRFDERISRNLRTLINIAEKDGVWFASYRECEPHVWRAIIS